MTKSIDFYFDFISPYSYLAHQKIKVIKKKNFKIYDLRNLYDPSQMKKNKIQYFSIGRSNTI